MFSQHSFDWKTGWSLFLALGVLVGFAGLEPEAGDAVNTAVGLIAIGCVLWVIWQLMQYDHHR